MTFANKRNYYFNEGKKRDYPHFSMRGEKEIGAEEIIDFKVLRKEEPPYT